MNNQCLYQIDYNIFPFKLRFSNSYKLYHEIQKLIEELSDVSHKLVLEISNKNKIKQLLEENFVYIGYVLKQILNYLHSLDAEHRNKNFKEFEKQLTKKIELFTSDNFERLYFNKIKEVSVVVTQLPLTWKCLTLRNKHLSNVPHLTTSSFRQVPAEQKHPEFKETSVNRDIQVIPKLITVIRKRILLLKNKINFLDENISCLLSNTKDYMKIIVKFEKELSETSYPNDEKTRLIRNVIVQISKIEDQIEFSNNSNSPNMYKFMVNSEATYLALKDTPNQQSIMPNISNNNFIDATSQDSKKSSSPNFINEIFNDPSIGNYETNSIIQ